MAKKKTKPGAKVVKATKGAKPPDLCFRVLAGKDQFYWMLVAPGGRVIALSTTPFADEAECRKGIEEVKSAWNAPVNGPFEFDDSERGGPSR